MGWTFTKHSRKSLINSLTQNENNKDRVDETCSLYHTRTCLKKCFKGVNFSGVLWTVWEVKTFDKLSDNLIKTYKYIGCDIIRYYKNSDGYNWGYKDMCESMGPYYYSCPISYLKMVECPNEYGKKWREAVIQRYETKRQYKSMTKNVFVHNC